MFNKDLQIIYVYEVCIQSFANRFCFVVFYVAVMVVVVVGVVVVHVVVVVVVVVVVEAY